ncbi:unnamed protein product [Soboliphyme baturini]|uniref:Pollen-specific leucine-rich repeat extensin-like protein 2 n=1 Tax=Soboliphyme baturini TaxID=241478 RepID=A0A183INN0_9BILA|nr:unnamed protein product [Soboliphyme baturini]
MSQRRDRDKRTKNSARYGNSTYDVEVHGESSSTPIRSFVNENLYSPLYEMNYYQQQKKFASNNGYETKTRSWQETNEDISSRMMAASSNSPPVVPKRDYRHRTPSPTVRRQVRQYQWQLDGADDDEVVDRDDGDDSNDHQLQYNDPSTGNVNDMQMVAYGSPYGRHQFRVPNRQASASLQMYEPIYSMMYSGVPPMWPAGQARHQRPSVSQSAAIYLPFPLPIGFLPAPAMSSSYPPHPPPPLAPLPQFPLTLPPSLPMTNMDFEMFTYKYGKKRPPRKKKKRPRSLDRMMAPPPPPFLPPPQNMPLQLLPLPLAPIPLPASPSIEEDSTNALPQPPPPLFTSSADDYVSPLPSTSRYSSQPANPVVLPMGQNFPAKRDSPPHEYSTLVQCDSRVPTSRTQPPVSLKTKNNVMNGRGYTTSTSSSKVSHKTGQLKNPLYHMCCRDLTQVLWIIVGIIIIGVIVGLILGLTLV